MNIIKVKNIETYEDKLVCRGKLVFKKADYVENCITGYYGTKDGNLQLTSLGYMGDYFITPVIVSEIEEPEKDELILGFNQNKILVPFEFFTQDLLGHIASGIFKEGDELLVECEKLIDGYDNNDDAVWRYEVLLNYVNVFTDKKEYVSYTIKDLRDAFYAGREQRIVHENDSGTDYEFVNSFEEWIKNLK